MKIKIAQCVALYDLALRFFTFCCITITWFSMYFYGHFLVFYGKIDLTGLVSSFLAVVDPN